jgi:two-component system OmpR family sensor kinase
MTEAKNRDSIIRPGVVTDLDGTATPSIAPASSLFWRRKRDGVRSGHSIRRRLLWWYGVVYIISILIFGALVYWRADRDIHDRAALQAIATAEYLDVSLKGLRPGEIDGPFDRGDFGRPGDMPPDQRRSPDDFGALSPWMLAGPPIGDPSRPGRPRDEGPILRRPPESGRRNPGPADRDRRGRDEPTANDIRPPLDGGPMSPERIREAEVRIDAIRPPGTDSPIARAPARRRIDRMEFTVLRRDGSILTQSADSMELAHSIDAGRVIGPAPVVEFVENTVSVAKRGPHGTLINVTRSLDNDQADLNRFGIRIVMIASGTMIVGLAGGWWISGQILTPLQRISDTASQISATQLQARIPTDQLDRELVPLAAVLNSTFARLEQSFSRLTQFTADASHELRTPLAVIQSQMELALSRPRSPEAYQQTLEMCLKSSDRMSTLIDGLLLLARADAERLELRTSIIDLRDVIESATAELQTKAESAGVDLECMTPEEAVHISGDARFLIQIPLNFIDNAIQASSPNSRISVVLRIEHQHAVFSVTDTGCGIAAEHRPFVFERFYRIDAGRSRKHGGSGLGLAICKSLVEAHEGTITCDSEPGKGTTFAVRLPLALTEKANDEIRRLGH